MNRFFLVTCSASLLSKTTCHLFNKTSFSAFSTSTPSSFSQILWKTKILHADITPLTLNYTLTSRFRVQFFSDSPAPTIKRKRLTKKKKLDPELSSMDEDNNGFYVVRKGDIVGVYKTLADCQAQVGTSVCDPSVSVYKGYSMPKDAEEYLTSRGLKDALYTINAADAKEDLFGALVPCPYQQPTSSKSIASSKHSPPKRSQKVLESTNNLDIFGSAFPSDNMTRKHFKLDTSVEARASSRKCVSCTMEFDGASKGNPGLSGAGAVLKADDGSLVCRLREGVGIATNNVAEYRAILLGLKHALKKGYTRIRVQGDSKLVCMQVQGLWKTKNENMAILCKEVKDLMDKFVSFEIRHVLRDLNSAADEQANLALNLGDGQVKEICGEM